MADLTSIENEVVNSMKDLGATSEEKKKTADDIAKRSNRPKSMVNNALVTLVQKNVVKRVAREKSAGYYVMKAE